RSFPSFHSIMESWHTHAQFSRDYWHDLLIHASKAAEQAAEELRNAQTRFPDVRSNIEDFVGTVHATIDAAADLRPHNIEEVEEEISWALHAVLEKAKSDAAVKDVLVKHGVQEEDAQVVLEHIGRLLVQMVVITGDIHELHPVLFDTGWIMRPLLSVFGFGPAGPVKGSAAAWMQRQFWGAAVVEDSWFSFLQRAGMTASKPRDAQLRRSFSSYRCMLIYASGATSPARESVFRCPVWWYKDKRMA
ncbi:hypothetical protein BD626DRAFT_499654, partial [Schizophyllum amplum]